MNRAGDLLPNRATSAGTSLGRTLRALALALTLVVMASVTKADEPDVPTASASGDARVAVAPDEATLRVAIVTEARKSEEAASANAEKGEAVLSALRKRLGREAEIRTVGYSLDPQYDYDKGAGRRLRGYIARNQIEVVTGQLELVGTAIDVAAQAGANDVDSLTFGIKDDLAVRLRALEEATRRARRKVDAMVGALGLRVVRVVSVSEQGTQHVVPVRNRAMRAEAFSDASTPVEPGTVEVRADVVLVAEIGD